MAIGILGKKLGMTRIYDAQGNIVPVTVIEAGPCQVLQLKSTERDGYQAVQLGFGDAKEKRATKALIQHCKKAQTGPKKFIREIPLSAGDTYAIGEPVTVERFAVGDLVDVAGTSKGKGFQGGMKRWGWRGGPGGHGSMFHRAPGGIQSGPRLTRLTKGKHMAGHMGDDRITVQNLEVVKVDAQNNLLVVRGAVAGAPNGYLVIRKSRKVKRQAPAQQAGGKGGAKAKDKKKK